jgi:chromosome segregation ATPase
MPSAEQRAIDAFGEQENNAMESLKVVFRGRRSQVEHLESKLRKAEDDNEYLEKSLAAVKAKFKRQSIELEELRQINVEAKEEVEFYVEKSNEALKEGSSLKETLNTVNQDFAAMKDRLTNTEEKLEAKKAAVDQLKYELEELAQEKMHEIDEEQKRSKSLREQVEVFSDQRKRVCEIFGLGDSRSSKRSRMDDVKDEYRKHTRSMSVGCAFKSSQDISQAARKNGTLWNILHYSEFHTDLLKLLVNDSEEGVVATVIKFRLCGISSCVGGVGGHL